MRGLILLICVGLTLATRRSYTRYDPELAETYFEEFIIAHNKHYGNEAEKLKRFEIFKKNLEIINKRNDDSQSAVYGITVFSDLTREEFIKLYTGLNGLDASNCDQKSLRWQQTRVADQESFDWRDKNKVSRVKDQSTCGSCWAFGATGNLESQYAIKYNKMLEFSEQQLVDCDSMSNGCSGTTKLAYPYLYWMQNGAISEDAYPYEGQDGNCRFDGSKVAVNVTGCVSYRPTSEERLKNILHEVGPLLISVDASSFKDYHGGIHDNCLYNVLNHAVLLVGYGTERGVPYWIIKNSWAETFGESGYIRVKRGVNACGIIETDVISAVIS